MPCKEDLAELAAAISAADKQVTYTDLGLGRGELSTGSGDLGRLIGRPTTSLAHGVADALR